MTRKDLESMLLHMSEDGERLVAELGQSLVHF
jgi:hypothetical protein